MKAHNTHCIQQNNQFLLNETAVFQFSKSWIWKFRYKKIGNDKRSHLVFKLSSASSHRQIMATHGRSLFRHSPTAVSIMRQRSRLAILLASVHSCARCFLDISDGESLLMILLTDVCEMRWRAFCRWGLWIFGALSWLRTRSSTSSMSSATPAVRRRPLPGADRLSRLPISSILPISVFKPPNHHCCFMLNILIYLLLKLAHKVKSYWKIQRGPNFMKHGV